MRGACQTVYLANAKASSSRESEPLFVAVNLDSTLAFGSVGQSS